ncbi:MFS transporter [Pseudomonas jessenii]|uniref:MFS transporter, DHA1 family, arabinose polymer transporter n=1 Tax=Pseudomonas jessenii TaxID=77298 RepID=A0A231GSE0_PSEJE|nr:MFS transporter [Pseudomonas jessenii]OXR39488.1 MFS transporter [Pseudomonas jessenii]SEC48078.1 MFS transporter, DHA1 family, arabinose polymer transporter [Pseudomonas jessenii]
MPSALWALALSAFGIGTTEFVIAGLLPQVAADFNISIPQAGNLATVYALGVFVGAPLLIILGTRIPRKGMLMLLMSLFVIGNLVTATASDFNIALLGRLVTSLTHGAFFGIGAILAADLVAPNKRVQAISFMFSGLTVANLVGVPVGTWLSQVMSWRDTFYAITAVGVLGFIGVMMLVPKIANHERPQIKKEFAAFANVRVLLAMGITVFGPAAFFTSITYIAPMMVEIAKFDPASVTWLMVVFGLGLFLGNILGGRYADKALMPLMYLTLGAQAIVLLIFSQTAHSQIMSVACILLMAGFGFATVSPIQKLVMDKARAAGAPTLASAVNIGLFNLGNAIGAWVGGFVISAGLGYAAPNWAGALLSVIALLLALASGAMDRRDGAPSVLQTA